MGEGPHPTTQPPQAAESAAPTPAATDFDRALMDRAIEQARRGRRPGASPIGCVIVLDGEIVAEGHNEVGLQHDPTAHAEMVAIRRACARLQREDLRGAVLYSTLQPCGMCTMASIWAHIGRIVYGAGRGAVHAMYFEGRSLDITDFIIDAYRTDLEVAGGVGAEACAALYYRPWDHPRPKSRAIYNFRPHFLVINVCVVQKTG